LVPLPETVDFALYGANIFDEGQITPVECISIDIIFKAVVFKAIASAT